MIRRNTATVVAFVCIATAGLGACVQYPTEKQQVVDLRPQISFNVDPSDTARGDARVVVDGLDMGRLGDFVTGKGALRLLPGTHAIRVVDRGQTALDQRVYLGDGVTRSFSLQ
jgi:hypothetical protein